jgi:tRNA (cytidine/uridine-2'-O-)-methyltransferase
MFHVVLFQPEIPPNTGNIIRLRRAGLDYHEYATLKRHQTLSDCIAEIAGGRIFAFTTKGSHTYANVEFRPGDIFLFGPESRGLPADILDSLPAEQRLRLPMQAGCRSLNLSNTVAIAVYEAWRQQGFALT